MKSTVFNALPDPSRISICQSPAWATFRRAQSDQFSIDAWIYPEKSESRVDTIVDKRVGEGDDIRGYALQLRGDTLIVRTQHNSASVTHSAPGTVPAQQWTHVTVTVDLANDQGILYIDGAQQGTFSPSSTGAGDLTNDSPLYIGRDFNGDAHFDGRIDEVEIFDRILDASEVGGLVKAGPCGKCRTSCFEGTASYTGGADDDFADGTDPSDPSPFLQGFSPTEPFDQSTTDLHFVHTFSNLKPSLDHKHICGAELEIRMRPSGSLDYNDTLSLNFSNGSGSQVGAGWGIHLGDNSFIGNWTDWLYNGPWRQAAGTGAQTFTLDLANLPPSGTNPTDLIADLDTHEMLNIRVQDDTEVDYAILRVQYCCDPHEPSGEEPDLAVEKSLDSELQIGQTSTYSISVDNVGNGDAQPTTEITDEIPKCLRIVGIASPWDQWCSVNNQTVSCQYPDPIAAGDSLPDIEIEVEPTDACGDLVENCATVSHDDDPNADNDESCVESEVSHQKREADMAIGKTVIKGLGSDGSLTHGGTAVYELTVTNNGPAAAQPPITVTDNLPNCLTYVAAQGNNWTCSTSGSGQVSCQRNSAMAPGASETITLEVQVTKECGDVVENCAKVEADAPTDPAMSNNKSCDRREVTSSRSDLTIDKKAAASGAAGTLDTYELTVTNNGPDTDPGPITVSDNLNACLTYDGYSGNGWNCSQSGTTVTCTHQGPLPAGQSLDLELQVSPSRACGDKIRNCAEVKSMADADHTNNESCVDSPVWSL